MAMLDTVMDAFTKALRDGGVDALREYPGTRIGRRKMPLVCVGAKSGRLSGSGMGDYLGTDKNGGGEIYALRLELVLGMEIFSPVEYDGGCIAVFEKISAALPQLPSGLKPSALICGEVSPDYDTGMLKCGAELHCTASLVCRAEEETGEFMDFELKGVLKQHDDK